MFYIRFKNETSLFERIRFTNLNFELDKLYKVQGIDKGGDYWVKNPDGGKDVFVLQRQVEFIKQGNSDEKLGQSSIEELERMLSEI